MAATRLLVAADDGRVGSIHEEHLVVRVALIHILEHLHERIEELTAPRIDAEHDLAHMAARMGAELHELRDEDRRQIVHAEIPEILEIAARLRLAAARHARDDDEPGCGLLPFRLALSRFLRAAPRLHRLRQFLFPVHSRHLPTQSQQHPFHYITPGKGPAAWKSAPMPITAFPVMAPAAFRSARPQASTSCSMAFAMPSSSFDAA